VERVALGARARDEAPGPELETDAAAPLLGVDPGDFAVESALLSDAIGELADESGGAALTVMTCPECHYQQVEADRCQNCGALMPWATLPP